MIPKTAEQIAHSVAVMKAERAVIEAAKAMRKQGPGSVKVLYAAVDTLIELEKQR